MDPLKRLELQLLAIIAGLAADMAAAAIFVDAQMPAPEAEPGPGDKVGERRVHNPDGSITVFDRFGNSDEGPPREIPAPGEPAP